VDTSVDRVWSLVTSPSDFAKIIPDLQKLEVIDERQFKASFKVGLGMIKGTMNMNFRFEDLQPATHVKVSGRGSGLQSTADLTLLIDLSPEDGKTQVSWSADITVGGLVASVGSRLLESAVKEKVREIIGGIKRVIEKAGKKRPR